MDTSSKSALTPESFDRFLSALDPDRERAAVRYEQIRQRLIQFFALKGRTSTEDLADEVINRVIRKLDAVEESQNVDSYIYRVASFLLMEPSRQGPSPISELPAPSVSEKDPYEEMGHECLDYCLTQLSSEARDLILHYYSEDRGGKIEERKALASKKGLTVNALRLRAFHIRETLHKCMTQCMERGRPKG